MGGHGESNRGLSPKEGMTEATSGTALNASGKGLWHKDTSSPEGEVLTGVLGQQDRERLSFWAKID